MVALIDQYLDKEFAQIVAQSDSYTDISRKLGYKGNSGAACTRIKQRVEQLGLPIEHFTYGVKNKKTRTPEEIFKKDSQAERTTLRRYYEKGKYTPYVCSICGQEPFWNGQEMTLILDHINGENHDHRLENLRWVCPNCNSQLPTTGGRNIKKNKKKYYCIDCGIEIYAQSTRCVKCESKRRKENSSILEYVTREELKNRIRTQTFTQIGKDFNVSDNAVKKWCDFYNLPRLKKDIKSYSDEEWDEI